MKVLYVENPYGDYGAVTFEQSTLTVESVLEEMALHDTTEIELSVGEDFENYDEEPTGLSFELFEFKEVDPEFIDFIRNYIQDYDDSKHRNFYIVEE